MCAVQEKSTHTNEYLKQHTVTDHTNDKCTYMLYVHAHIYVAYYIGHCLNDFTSIMYPISPQVYTLFTANAKL